MAPSQHSSNFRERAGAGSERGKRCYSNGLNQHIEHATYGQCSQQRAWHVTLWISRLTRRHHARFKTRINVNNQQHGSPQILREHRSLQWEIQWELQETDRYNRDEREELQDSQYAQPSHGTAGSDCIDQSEQATYGEQQRYPESRTNDPSGEIGQGVDKQIDVRCERRQTPKVKAPACLKPNDRSERRAGV